MKKLNALLEKAQYSSFYLWLLNFALLRVVPFNKPHRIKIIEIGNDSITLKAKNIRANRNHVNGMHACLLATLCEYASGLSLLRNFSADEYRILLKNIQMSYHKQAKSAVIVRFQISAEEIQKEILDPLKEEDAVFKEYTVEAYDKQKNHICTGQIKWQIKPWKKLRKNKSTDLV